MRKSVLIIIILILVVGAIALLLSDKNIRDNSPVSVTPISHATLVLEWNESTIYLDPVGGVEAFENQPSPDLILITDIHGDHLSLDTLNGVVGSSTSIVSPQAVADELDEGLLSQTQILSNGDILEELGFNIKAMPMYNIPQSKDSYHVKGRGNGYIIENNNYRVYVAGDTSGIPEMRSLEDINMAFVPMNLPYTMTVDEAADAVLDFTPDIVYPYHYRGTEGLSDVGEFKNLVESENSNIKVVLLDWYPDN